MSSPSYSPPVSLSSNHNHLRIIYTNALRLKTFGGLWLTDQAGAPVEHPRPRRIALLAILAAATPRAVSRERLLGILWPDGTEDRGRHALAQTVYSLRADLGSDAALGGSTELKIDPAIIGSDVAEFNAAFAAGDLATAAQLYFGPFLDGFYLSDAPAFERWVEEERARLAGMAIVAIEHLAKSTGEIIWRKRLTELDPLRARYASDYMSALAAAGDRGAALGHARAHEARVRRELDESPEPEVTQLADRLRGARAAPDPAPSPVPVAKSHATSSPTPAATPRRDRRSTRRVAVFVVALAAAGFLVWRATDSPPASGLPLLAVGTVRDGAARDLNANGGVLTDMLATSLARIRGLEVVANSRLLEVSLVGPDSVSASLPDAARRAGAKEILEGELTLAPDGNFRMELRRIDLGSGVMRQGYTVQAVDRYSAVDSATAAIARDFGLSAPNEPIAEVSTASAIAYRLYEEGLRAFYHYDLAAAARLMDAALREDSTFAMAAYHRWRSAHAMLEPSAEPVLRALALRLAPRAPERERLLIRGSILWQEEDPAAFAQAESLAIRFPADPIGQQLLGNIQRSRGDFPAAAAALLRAVALDSAASSKSDAVCRACEVLQGLFDVYVSWDSLPAAERTVRTSLQLRPNEPWTLDLLAETYWRQERWNEAESVLRMADSVGRRPNDVRSPRFRSGIRRGAYDELGKTAALALLDPNRDNRSEARWIWLIALRNQGRLREAMALAKEGRIPGGGLLSAKSLEPDLLNQAILAFESADYATAIRLFRAHAATANTISMAGHRARGVSWNLTHAGAAYAAAGDTGAVRRLADSLEIIGPRSIFGRSARLHHFLRGLLLAAAGRHAEAVEAYRRAHLSWTEGYTRINLEMARSLVASNRPNEAILPLQQALRGGIDGSNLYVTRTELHELLAQVFVAAGQPDSAGVHYAAVARAWERADPPFQSRRQAALAWLEKHRRE